MTIGILSENSDDSTVLKELARRIITEGTIAIPSEDLIFLPPLEARTSIMAKMQSAPILFFDGKVRADLIIFGVDLDGDASRRRRVAAFIKSEQQRDSNRVIVPLCMEPHLERIFFEDGGGSIKTIISKLPPADPIPYKEMPPKYRLAKLIKEFGPDDVLSTRMEIYRQLTAGLDLRRLSQVKASVINFKNFKSDLEVIIAQYLRRQ
jgi:hypothetical protein